MKYSCSDVVQVPEQCEQASPLLVIPYLFERVQGHNIIYNTTFDIARHDLRLVKIESKVLYFDLVVIASRYEKWLLNMEADSANRTVMLLKLVQECTHAVVP
jgi:homospermidine synthase